jgi:hypothetical protein
VSCQSPACDDAGDARNLAESLMMVAGSRDMTVSMMAAQFLRSAHQSRPSGGPFKDRRIYRVSGVFLRLPATGNRAAWCHVSKSGLSG